MRLIFSLLGLLLAVAIVGLLAKQQLQAVQPGGAASAPAAGAAPAQRSQQLQQRAADDVKRALEQGMQRNESEAQR